MSSTFTRNVNIEKPGQGEQAGTWGMTANNNYDTIDTALDGFVNIPLPASQTLPGSPFSLSATQVSRVISFSGVQSGTGYIQIDPATSQRVYFARNQTGDSGGAATGHPLVFQQVQTGQSPGGTFSLDAGYDAILYADGAGNPANVAAIENPQFHNVLIKGTLTVTGSQGQTSISLDTTDVTDVNKIRQVLYTTSGSSRWAIQATTGPSESDPNNPASDLKVLRYANDGSLPADGSAMYLSRSNGNVTIGPGANMGARLAVVASSGSNQTVLDVQCVAGQSTAAFLVRDDSGTTTANKFAVDSAGNLRVYGAMQMWASGSGQTGWSGSITGAGLNMVFVGGVLVSA